MNQPPKFTELMRVLVKFPSEEAGSAEGYVLRSEWQIDQWVYEISFEDLERPGGSYDNWAPECWLTER